MKKKPAKKAARNERTGKGIASDAGKLLEALATCPDDETAIFSWVDDTRRFRTVEVKAKTAKGAFASLLTQTSDRITKEARKRAAGK